MGFYSRLNIELELQREMLGSWASWWS